ncbi:MAG: metal-dependent hydrolase [Candidatus Hodarchaeales archaeon]
MAWFPTHFTLEGLVAWLLLSEKRKEQFKQYWYVFLLLNVVALVPDTDVIFRAHRGIFNSLVLPMSIFMLGLVIFLSSRTVKNDQRKKQLDFLAICVFLIAFYWGFHIVLDFDAGGPNALFYPLDNKMYEINYLLEMTSQAAIPVKLVIDVIFQPLSSGLNTYFLNWTPSERVDVFGQTFFISLPSLILNLSIALCWLFVVGKEVIPWHELKKYSGKRGPVLKKMRMLAWNAYTAIGLVFLLFGFFLGPVLGLNPAQSVHSTNTIQLSPQSFSPSFSAKMETMDQILQPGSPHDVDIEFTALSENSSGNLTWVGIFTLSSQYSQNFTVKTLPLFIQHFNVSSLPENDTAFKLAYRNTVDGLLSGCIAATEPLEDQDRAINVKITKAGTYEAAVVLYDWDSSLNISELMVSRKLTVSMIVKYDRTVNYVLSSLLQLTGIVFITGPAVIEIYRYQKAKGKTDLTKDIPQDQ